MGEGPLADPERVGKKRLQERLIRRNELDDVATILEMRSGRRFFWRLLSECGLYRTSMTGNNTTFFNEGMRNIGLKFMADVQEFPDLYLKMMKESREPVEEEKEDGPRMPEGPKSRGVLIDD